MEIYLDNSATTKPCCKSIEACVMAMESEYGNPSSLHKMGFHAEQLITCAQKEISKSLNCNYSEILFTSGATEANNLAIIGSAIANKRRGNKIITTAIEHPSVKEAMNYLKLQGYIIQEIMPNDKGEYSEVEFFNAVNEKTVLVSCMLVNNETGLILPIEKIAKAVKSKNPQTIVHVDAVQGFLKIPIKLKESNIDLLSISGHKVYAPKGIGALYIKKGVRLIPQTYGGNQQNGIRSGTEATQLIAAFGAAVSFQRENITDYIKHYQELNAYLVEKLRAIAGVKINSNASCASHILNISVEGIRSEVLLHFLEQYNIYVSSGSACARGKQSYVLSALGFDKQTSDTAIRISFGIETTLQQLDIFVERLKEGINTLAKIR